ncbi:hypothetical protein HanXRQr2_Chr07g0309121 [Helianthus annuus]|uniref:Uncharacterized protein n=1 Tax=Helianthus annuus TaxID=4232 RepID=A0A9K3IMW4_HELAN|nr:hypothetical protein HanXRQr2_Chr07g0309121 [Helianthus annuus]
MPCLKYHKRILGLMLVDEKRISQLNLLRMSDLMGSLCHGKQYWWYEKPDVTKT